tara:strand:- start:1692 stop:2264 length:573 start_codon:yes stop_codon:yes gene_type:complete
MGATALSKRGNWQKKAGERGKKAEKKGYGILKKYLGDDFIVATSQKYTHAPIYNTMMKKRKIDTYCGLVPDGVVLHVPSGNGVFVEIKCGGAEGGNAHERACKYKMDGIKSRLIDVATNTNNIIKRPKYFDGLIKNIVDEYVVWMFDGATFAVPRYVDELQVMFEGEMFYNLNHSDFESVANDFKKILTK